MSDEKIVIDVDNVFEVCNASLRAASMTHCPLKKNLPCLDTCLCCGDSECFDSWRAQNKLWEIDDERSLREIRFMQNARPKALFVSPKTETEPDNEDRNLFNLYKEK